MVLAAGLGGAGPLLAACGEPEGRPRLGLVLSGGGARGLAHVGVLKELERQGVRPDCIAGTSMGALIGGLYASGYTAHQIEEVVGSLDWQRIFSGRPERALVPLARRVDELRPLVRVGFSFWRLRLPPAAEPDFRLRRFLFSLLAAPTLRAGREFDRLPIPFRAVAADLGSGERVVLGQGSLEAAIRASVAAPVTLSPVRLQQRWLVDGGVVDNLPVGVAREMGADVVIAVDVRSPPSQPEAEGDVVDVATQLADVLIRHRNDDFPRDPDLVVEPLLDGMRNVDYALAERAIAAGEEAAARQAADIRAAAGAASPAGADSDDGVRRLPAQPVAAVRVAGNERVRESLIREAFAVKPGDPADVEAALRGLDAVWATGLFRSAWLDVLPADSGLEMVVHVQEAQRGTVELAAGFDETEKAKGAVRIRHGNLLGRGERLELVAQASEARTALRGELSVDGLFGFPLGYFLQGGVSEWRPRPFRDGLPLPRAEFDRVGITAGAQTHLGPSILLRAQAERARVGTTAHREAGFLADKEDVATIGGMVLWDTLDDSWLPGRGGFASLAAHHSLPALGADRSYWRALGSLRLAAPLGRAGFLEVDGLGFTSGGPLPLFEQIQLGGPVLVPGLERDGLWGPHAAAAAISYRLPLLRGLQAIARAGAGGVWPTRDAVSVSTARHGFGLGLQQATPLGPLALEWGRAEGQSRVYVSLGYR